MPHIAMLYCWGCGARFWPSQRYQFFCYGCIRGGEYRREQAQRRQNKSNPIITRWPRLLGVRTMMT